MGPGDTAGLGRNSPAEPISGGRFTAIARSFLPSQPAPCGGKNFAAPKINLTQVPAPSRGTGARGSAPAPARLERTLPKKPRPFPGREKWRSRHSLGALWQMCGSGQELNPPPSSTPRQKPVQKRGSGEQPPPGGRAAQCPALRFSPGLFRLQTNSRTDPAAPGPAELQGPGTPCPPPGPICFPPKNTPRRGAGHGRARTAPRCPAAGPGEGGDPKLERPPGPA